MTSTFMIRHGKPLSTWGEAGEADPGLDAAGLAQAEAAAERLMALAPDVRPGRVFSSPLRRCRETAAPFARRLGVSVEIDARFGEIPTPDSVPVEARADWLRAAFKGRWTEIVGGPDYDAWRRTVAAALAERAGTAVFSHFVAINAVAACALDTDAVVSFQPGHASITLFDCADGRLTLLEHGDEAVTQVL